MSANVQNQEEAYETEKRKLQGLDPQRKRALASCKLAYIIGQNKKPLSYCEHYASPRPDVASDDGEDSLCSTV